MTTLDLLIDMHRNHERQGPGSLEVAERALQATGVLTRAPNDVIQVADLGCGTGVASLFLAQKINALVTSVDLAEPFLSELEHQAKAAGVADRIRTLQCSMSDLPFEPASLDVIWSEGSVYNIGFKTGLQYWKQFLKPGGVLVVSEIAWITEERPDEIQEYWDSAYPGIGTKSEKTAIAETCGYTVLEQFVLPEDCWLEQYYAPIERDFEAFLERHDYHENAAALVAYERQEIEMYRKYKEFYSYGMWIFRA